MVTDKQQKVLRDCNCAKHYTIREYTQMKQSKTISTMWLDIAVQKAWRRNIQEENNTDEIFTNAFVPLQMNS